MAQIFYVVCPACNQKFPCHTELWEAGYDLLCPFCHNSFAQSDSPSVISPSGEQSTPKNIDPEARAESM